MEREGYGAIEWGGSVTSKSNAGEKKPTWYSENSEKAKASAAAWRAANRERVKATNLAWAIANPEKKKEATARWAAANPERHRATNAKWKAANPDKTKKMDLKRRAENPEIWRIYQQNRRARLIKAGGNLSHGLSDKLFKLQKGKCPCCGQQLGDDYHMDHIMPLALGGTNTDDNMQLLTAKCNLQKSAKHPLEFMQKRGYLL